MIPKKYHYFLYALAKAHSPEQRKRLLAAADPEIIKIIIEIAYNILEGNISLTKSQKRKLYPYRNCFHLLTDKQCSLKKKQTTLVNQKGGFLPFLIPIISTLAGGLLGSIFKK